jgi:hypothetical protein
MEYDRSWDFRRKRFVPRLAKKERTKNDEQYLNVIQMTPCHHLPKHLSTFYIHKGKQ